MSQSKTLKIRLTSSHYMQRLLGAEQKEQSKVADIPHLSRFLRVSTVLLINVTYSEVEIFFGSLDWEADKNVLSLVKENFITFAKKKHWEANSSASLMRMKFL